MQYKRLIYFDVDGLVLKNMNHLFLLPSAPVAMPRAYWLTQPTMSDQLAVVEPSAKALNELLHQAETFGNSSLSSLSSSACIRCCRDASQSDRHLTFGDEHAHSGMILWGSHEVFCEELGPRPPCICAVRRPFLAFQRCCRM